jgi:CelD/BcsL family acetyltransferase involved in cellulose biosynthesis
MLTADTAVAARAGIRVKWITDAAAFRALRSEWTRLLRASPANGPFLAWEWLHPWYCHCAEGADLRLLCVHDGDELIAIAPFVLARGRLGWPSRLEFLGTGYAGSDYLDVIVRDGRDADALNALSCALEATRLSLRLRHVSERAVSVQLSEGLANRRWVHATTADGVCPVISLAGHTWDSYLGTLGAAHRANVRRRLRTLDRTFRVRFEQVRSDAARRDALEALVRFHRRRYVARGGSTAFARRDLEAFHEDSTRHALEAGWLRMFVLRLDDAIAAVMYGFLYDRRFYFYQHGFDDRFGSHSIGLVLMAMTVRAAIDEDADAFDLLWGDEAYKALWARDAVRLCQVHVFPPHVTGRIQQHAVATRRSLARLARRVLPSGDTRAA